jgi:hypothetical protein
VTAGGIPRYGELRWDEEEDEEQHCDPIHRSKRQTKPDQTQTLSKTTSHFFMSYSDISLRPFASFRPFGFWRLVICRPVCAHPSPSISLSIFAFVVNVTFRFLPFIDARLPLDAVTITYSFSRSRRCWRSSILNSRSFFVHLFVRSSHSI